MNNTVSKDDFVNRLLFVERQKKIKKAKDKEKALSSYISERCYDREKGKKSTYKIAGAKFE